MKTATFKHILSPSGRLICGTVTLKDDGKTSISIYNSSSFKSSDRFKAKAVALKIIENNFKHEAVTSFKEDEESLIKLLKSYTTDLSEKYINDVKAWEKQSFINTEDWLNNVTNLKGKKWFDFFNIDCEEIHPNTERAFWNVNHKIPKNERLYYKVKKQIEFRTKYVSKGIQSAIDNAEKDAINHYNLCVSKLADRVKEKGMNINEMKVIKSGVDINITLVLTDGKITIHARTIFAEGEKNRPHFRYLVN